MAAAAFFLAPSLAVSILIGVAAAAAVILALDRRGRLPALNDLTFRAEQAPQGQRILQREALATAVAGVAASPEVAAAAPDVGTTQSQVLAEMEFALQELRRRRDGEQLLVNNGDLPMRRVGFRSLGELDEYRSLASSWSAEGYIYPAEFNAWVDTYYPAERSRIEAIPVDWIALGQQFAAGTPMPDTRFVIGQALASRGMLKTANPQAFLNELPGTSGLSWEAALAFYQSRDLIGRFVSPVAPPVTTPPVVTTTPPATGSVIGQGQAIVAASPTGVVVGHTTVNVPELNVARLAEGISSGLAGVLPQALAMGLSLPLQNLSQRFHHDRNACLQSTGALLKNLAHLATSAAPLVGGGFLLDQVEQTVMPVLETFLRDALNPARLPQPMTEADVEQGAVRLIQDRVRFGLQAHLVAQTMELATPLKHLGANQYAALLADLAGFQRLATAMQGPVEFSAITQPMRYKANRLYRTTLPDINLAQFMYAKKEIQPSEFVNTLEALGYQNTFIRQLSDAAFMDPRLAEIVRIGQFFQPQIDPQLARPLPEVVDWWSRRGEWLPRFGGNEKVLGPDWYFIYKMAKGGYDPPDVLVLTEVAKRATARREQTLALDSITRLYRDGFIGDDELRTRVNVAWALEPDTTTFSNPISARLMATRWRAEAEDLADRRDLVLASFSRGLIDDDRARSLLVELGMPAHRARMEVTKERLGLIRRTRLEVPEGEEGSLLQEVAGG